MLAEPPPTDVTMMGSDDRVATLIGTLDAYRPARQTLLASLQLPDSNRDPLAEWSEHFVAALLGGVLAVSRVQADYDLILADGNAVQVRYLANTVRPWVNEHRVHRIPGVRYYALVLFEAFRPVGAVVFDTDRLADICVALGKRHSDKAEQLQFTYRNWLAIRDDPASYRAFGTRVWVPDLG
jgi:hypothetical protein